MKTNHIVLDFETKPIVKGSPRKPAPVGLAIKNLLDNPMYYAWGHASNNGVYTLKRGKLVKLDGDPEQLARRVYAEAMRSGRPILGQNIGKFDIAVAEDHWSVKPPTWDRVDDTMFALFLFDPHAQSFSLKPSAERLLGEKPAERDAVFDWLANHGLISKPRMEKGKLKYPKDAGAHIWEAPGDLVARYGIGDTTRPEALFPLLMKQIEKDGMRAAYDRERELVPILRENEREGMRVDLDALTRDVPIYEKALQVADAWLRKRLRKPGLNLDSDADVANALKSAGIVTEFAKTPTGRDSVSKKLLTIDKFHDKKVFHALYYRNALTTVLTMSMRPWLEQGSKYGGYIFTEWNQVKRGDVGGYAGAASGRITCSYFQNITKTFMDRGDGYEHPAFLKVPELPLVRVYLLPDKGGLFGHSDFDQQELKLVAHYEDGALAEMYRRNPKTDIHGDVRDLIKKVTGKEYERRPVKVVDFQTAYGGGTPALMNTLHISEGEARELRAAWKAALPDVVALDTELKQRYKDGLAIRTLGGRLYRCKPPAIAKKGTRKGELVQFFYTALNYLIQPSAADQTKQAIINYNKHPKRQARMVVTVHDEINVSLPKGREREELRILQECMVGAFKLDVPVTTTLKIGPSWGKLKKLDEIEKEAA